ncbi:MAG: carbohydrate ABC transporter permease [Cellulomonadaceae bacterium]|jgi:cellobiose transport system permease protein|nr:carbohydrate ABC transporter permease [Cellulomonadaceae bacterium]
MSLDTSHGNREVSVAALRQTGGKGVAQAAARKRKKMGNTSEGRQPGWVSYVILGLVILISIFPIYYAVSLASQPTTATQYGVQALIPRGGLGGNLTTAFGEIGFGRALAGTAFVAILCSASTVLFSTLAGYSFAKLKFRGRGPLMLFVVGTMAVPTQLAIVPLYLMMVRWGLYTSLWAVIIPGLVTAFGVFWMTQYLEESLPYELIEAARMDGCSMIRTFWAVAIPAARPAAAMLALFTFVAQWTNYFWPMLILGPNNKAMLTVAAATLRGARYTDYTMIMSGVILTAFPLIILFFFVGKQLVSGIMAGAVKG